ncbi:hypothetical protein Hanom_Chr06g00554991 [Helianthus anomalus]
MAMVAVVLAATSSETLDAMSATVTETRDHGLFFDMRSKLKKKTLVVLLFYDRRIMGSSRLFLTETGRDRWVGIYVS